MFLPVLSKLISESLLSLYPIFVKKIGISMTLQMWTRTIAYVAIAMLFVDWSYLKTSLTSLDSLSLALTNLAHIFFSYEGFRHLDSGVSFAIFNTYPIMIVLMEMLRTGTLEKIKQDYVKYLLVLAGLAFFIYGNFAEESSAKLQVASAPDFTYGFIMILLAAFTEALIYFLVRRVKTDNHWNHVFISYFFGAIVMTMYVFYVDGFSLDKVVQTLNQTRVGIATGLNGFIGSVGYFLRFYASYHLDASVFAILSYFGIIMSYIYGIAFNNESLTFAKVLGTIFIIVSQIQ